MKLENKRIYINNLPQSVTQADLEQKFSEFGNVDSVEIKKRKNEDSDLAPQFAYVTLTITKHDLSNCFEEFNSKKWKGHWISLQEAKESFMERLKREREQQATSSKPEIQPTTVYKNASTAKRIVYHSSSSDEETVKNDVIVNGFKKIKKCHLDETPNNIAHQSKDVELVQDNTDTIEKPKQHSEADQKRLESLMRKRQNYQQQKQILKISLANIDSKPKNKIKFDNDSDGDMLLPKGTKTNTTNSSKQKNRTALFDDDEEPEQHEFNFDIKEQYEGKKGQKLMQLQSRFKNDKRFEMDERFLDDEVETNLNEDNTVIDKNMTLDEEKEKQFEILEEVLGKKIKHKPVEKEGTATRQNLKMMLRFDPSQPNHSKFEIKENKKVQKTVEKEQTKLEAVDEAPKPEVSKETFYKIAVNLKDTLHEKEEFSLANLFNKTIETAENEKDVDVIPKNKPKSLYQPEPDPFHCDDSADEEDATIKVDEKHVNDVPVHHNKVGPAKLWTESFFFKHDDYRLQEGLDFIKRLEVDDQSDFTKLRRNLHEIVKAKVRNNQRKNRPFRKKLGGKKRLRVKRAMKR